MKPCLGVVCAGVLAVAALAAAAEGEAAGRPWVGDVAGGSLRDSGQGVLLTLRLVEDLRGGASGAFEEGDIAQIRRDPAGRRVEIMLDRVSPGRLQDFVHPAGMVRRIRVDAQPGSFSNPDEQVTAWGRPIESARIVLEGAVPLAVALIGVDKADPSQVLLIFRVRRGGEGPPEAVDGALADEAEIGPEAVDAQTPPARPIGSAAVAREREKLEELSRLGPDAFVTVVYPARHSSPAALQALVEPRKSLLGSLSADADRSILVITDRAPYVRSILETLLAADRPVPQVRIEVTITEVTARRDDERGVTYSFLMDSDTEAGDVGVSTAPPGADGAIGGFYRGFSGSRFRALRARLDLLIRENEAKLLAQPTVLIANNKTATLTTGRKVPVARLSSAADDVTETAGREAAGGTTLFRETERTAVSERDRTVEFLDVGVSLAVTPRIFQADEAILDITPAFTEILDRSGVGGAPVLSNRSLTSSVRVRSGEGIGIGGLFEEKEVSERRGVPGLKDIPLLGALFRYNRKVKVTSEIIFLLKVEIAAPE